VGRTPHRVRRFWSTKSLSFNQLGLSTELLRAIADKGYRQATPIQQQAIPHILAGRDILAGAQTGTGKTAGFTLPLLQRLQVSHSNGRRLRVLVLTPTRELAAGAWLVEENSGHGRVVTAAADYESGRRPGGLL